MPRTTSDQVKGIIDVSPSERLDLDPFILTANAIVTDKCLPSQTSNPTVYTNDRLELIERWLSAHFWAVNRRRAQRGDVSGGASEWKDWAAVDLHLNSTLYGQSAIALDTDGNLAAYNNALDEVVAVLPNQRTRVVWLGS